MGANRGCLNAEGSARLFFEFLAHTGLRIGEAVALTWADVDLGKRRITVRRRYYRGRYAAPKSKYGRRSIPLSDSLAQALWRARGAVDDDVHVFSSATGKRIEPSNLMSRVLKPAAVEAGISEWVCTKGRERAETWVGFHTFRHTCATMLFRHGLNAKQVQMWLGHHSPAFTLSTYVHLLPDDLPDVSFLDSLHQHGSGADRLAASDIAVAGQAEPKSATFARI